MEPSPLGDDLTLRDLIPVGKDTIGGNLRLTFLEPSSDRMVVLEFTSFEKLRDSRIFEQMLDGTTMMRGLGIWPTPPEHVTKEE